MLVYPLFDSQPATSTIINVTNTNTDRTVCSGNDNLQVGDVRLHYVYYGAQMADLDAGISAPWLNTSLGTRLASSRASSVPPPRVKRSTIATS